MIKRRKMKISDRGVYLQDIELKDTTFQIKSHYRYIIDVKSKKIVIVSSDNEKDNTVSKRAVKDGYKPVIDIRSKEVKDVLSLFKGSEAEFLQVTISDEKITIEEYKESNSCLKKAGHLFNRITGKNKKVISITDILPVKNIRTIEMSLKQLNRAVGYEQLSFNFDYTDISSITSEIVQNAIKQLDIPLKVCSLYSGCGMLDKGFIDAGFEVIFATDISKDACLTYEKNIGKHIVNADINDLNLKDIPPAPVYIGGTPCVKYTNSNRKNNINKQIKDDERILDIPDNILLRKYIEVIKNDPECVIFVHENVGQVNTIGDGKLLEEIKDELGDFEITTTILNSSDFGSAQIRSRSIIIGSKIGKITIEKPAVRIVKTVRQALEGLTEKIANQTDYSKSKPHTIERMKYIEQGGNVFDIPEAIRPSSQHSDYMKRLEWDKQSVTIVNPRKSMLLHPEEQRILSVRECARIQGLKDDFIFFGTLANKQQQVANGVPQELAIAIAKKIKQFIEYFNKNKLNYA